MRSKARSADFKEENIAAPESARYMMDHGVMADMCIIGENLPDCNCKSATPGWLWARVSVDG